jgi:hypothetical protein
MTVARGTSMDGYCRLRQAERGFRLDRIEKLMLLAETFVVRRVGMPERQWITVRVWFAAAIMRRVLERQHYGFVALEETASGCVMTFRAQHLSELLPWLLGWGSHCKPLRPDERIEAVRFEVTRLLEQLTWGISGLAYGAVRGEVVNSTVLGLVICKLNSGVTDGQLLAALEPTSVFLASATRVCVPRTASGCGWHLGGPGVLVVAAAGGDGDAGVQRCAGPDGVCGPW